MLSCSRPFCGASSLSSCRLFCRRGDRGKGFPFLAKWEGRFFSSGGGAGASSGDGASSFDQFQKQQQQYHRHSFYSTTEDSHSDDSQFTQGSSDFGGRGTRMKDHSQHKADGATHTSQERRNMSKKWENAFFARVHYEEAMHEKYAEAMRVFENAHSKHSSTASDGAGGDWPDDDAIPSHVFHSLTPGEQQHYIIRRLSLGEKRIRYCPDFGSLSMMYQLNLGESMISEAERWLKEMNWMNEELEAQIASVRKEAYRIKYDYDLE